MRGLWVEVTERDGDRWEILSPDGTPVGWLSSFPRSHDSPLYLGGERIVWVTVDSLGIQHVEVAALTH